MYIDFGDSLISTSCIAGFKREEYFSNYYIKIIFNRKVKNEWGSPMKFETEEEMNKKWNELKMMLCPMTLNSYGAGYGYGPLKDIPENFVAKLEKDSNPFFIHTDLANGNPV